MSYISDIEAMVDKISFGEVNFTVVRKKGETRSLLNHNLRTHRYTSSVDAIADLLKVLKSYTESAADATIELSMTQENGVITAITYRYSPAQNYKG